MSQRQTQLKCIALIFVLFLSSTDAWIRLPWWSYKERKEEPRELEESTFEQVRRGADSGAFRGIIGWFIIKAIGTGTRCLEKRLRFGTSLSRDFGNSTDTDAFLHLYGRSQCQLGDVGFMLGIVRAWIVAEAYRSGTQCVARVLSDVSAYQTSFCSMATFQLEVGGNAEGEAFSVCNEE
eukprot:g5311.t1